MFNKKLLSLKRKKERKKKKNLFCPSRRSCLGIVLQKLLFSFTSLAQEVGFHLYFEKVGRFHISNIIWDITPNLCTDVREILFWYCQSWFRYMQIVCSASFVLWNMRSPRKLSFKIFWAHFSKIFMYNYGSVISNKLLNI